MPVNAYDDKRIKLKNEITDQDFELGPEPKVFGWFQSNFGSGLYADNLRYGRLCESIANFLNERARGPYYLYSGYINSRDKLEVTIFDPRDRKDFAQAFGDRLTTHETISADENAEMILNVMLKGGYFQNPSLQDLLDVVTAHRLNGGAATARDVESLMERVWEEPMKPQSQAMPTAAGPRL